MNFSSQTSPYLSRYLIKPPLNYPRRVVPRPYDLRARRKRRNYTKSHNSLAAQRLAQVRRARGSLFPRGLYHFFTLARAFFGRIAPRRQPGGAPPSRESGECQREYLFTPRIFRAYIRTREGVKPFFSRIFIHSGQTRRLYRRPAQSQALNFSPRKLAAYISSGNIVKPKNLPLKTGAARLSEREENAREKRVRKLRMRAVKNKY